MTIAQGSIPQNDTLVTPILQAVSTVITQIAGVGTVYTQVPDMPPEDNSIVLSVTDLRVQDNMTNAKLVLDLKVQALHLFRRTRLADNLAAVFSAIPAWLTVMTAWSNQTLGGLSQNLNLTDMKVTRYQHANQDYVTLNNTISVRVVWNLITG